MMYHRLNKVAILPKTKLMLDFKYILMYLQEILLDKIFFRNVAGIESITAILSRTGSSTKVFPYGF